MQEQGTPTVDTTPRVRHTHRRSCSRPRCSRGSYRSATPMTSSALGPTPMPSTSQTRCRRWRPWGSQVLVHLHYSGTMALAAAADRAAAQALAAIPDVGPASTIGQWGRHGASLTVSSMAAGKGYLNLYYGGCDPTGTPRAASTTTSHCRRQGWSCTARSPAFRWWTETAIRPRRSVAPPWLLVRRSICGWHTRTSCRRSTPQERRTTATDTQIRSTGHPEPMRPIAPSRLHGFGPEHERHGRPRKPGP